MGNREREREKKKEKRFAKCFKPYRSMVSFFGSALHSIAVPLQFDTFSYPGPDRP